MSNMSLVRRGLVHLFSEEDLERKLDHAEKSGKQLTIKLGADPSSSDLHLGHAVVLRKLRQFQDLGHKVVLIIGDFTAMIGDPTGKSKTRPTLTLEQARENAESYVEQATKVLDAEGDKLEVLFNSKWLGELKFHDLVSLAQHCTVARMLERDDFSKRYKKGVPVGLHEFLYPLAQAYDSVEIKADVELGGTDQLFNLLVGRDIQKAYGQEEQVVMTLPLLVGLDGSEKMSKSLDNYIGLSESPEDMFRKAMRVPDTLLPHYFELCTDIDLELVKEEISSDVRNAHRIFARELVRMYHGEGPVSNAENRYDLVAKNILPTDLPEFHLTPEDLTRNEIPICELATRAGLTKSKSEARRFIEGRGFKLNGSTVTDPALSVGTNESVVLQIGKDRFVRVVTS